MNRLRIVLAAMLAACSWAALLRAAEPADPKGLAAEILASAGAAGGLCVHIGCGDGGLTANLSAEGRFLVHGLDADAAAVEAAARLIRSRGIYGQVWVEAYAGARLPYAENLVNLVVSDDPARMNVPAAEVFRVLVPEGVAYIGQSAAAAQAGKPLDAEAIKKRLADAGFTEIQSINRGGAWIRAKKPRPPAMDDWGHPRHGPGGNAVSADTLVGPPRRVRWIAGPMHESSNIVTAGGRFFYAGLIARDAFNGLRLWDRKLDPTPMRLGFVWAAVPGSALPVASGNRLYVVTGGKLAALDAATGVTVREYPEAGAPTDILLEGKTLVASDATTLRVLAADTGKVLWSHTGVQMEGVVAGEGGVFFLGGEPKAGSRAVQRHDLATGARSWRKTDYPWLTKVQRLSCYKGLLVCEVSTFTNDRPGNGIHVLKARDGSQAWEHLYEPGQNHFQQARALQTDDRIWVLAKGAWQGLDRSTGSVKEEYKAGPNHCFPPAATHKYLLGGEMSFTDVHTGQTDANRISKGNCGRDTGFVPANGLLYVSPKHCSCYPMLKGYTALAPARGQGSRATKELTAADFVAERGPAFGAASPPPQAAPAGGDWPSYRADIWRSASTAAAPAGLDVLWTADIGDWPAVRSLPDWKENPWIRGPVTPPVAACGMVYLAQPDGHRVLALDAQSGKTRWDFTANGRVDTPPTISGGLCLFGTSSGYVYCLRAADGKLVWRLRAAPEDERIVAYGQLESPWPVPGSILVVGGTAYFAAGRQALADGGIRIFAADPATGAVKAVKAITSLPQTAFYAGSGLEFDVFDLLVAENRPPAAGTGPAPASSGPDFVTLSRWRLDLATHAIDVAWESGFGYYGARGEGVFAPRGLWTYGQRMDYMASGPRPGNPDFVATHTRPLAAFRGRSLFCSSENKQQLFRRDFHNEAFNDKWFNQRQLPHGKDAPGDRNRSQRLAHGAAWQREVFDGSDKGQGIGAVILAGDTVFVAGTRGRLIVLAAGDGRTLAERNLAAPVWDGLAAAYGRLFVSAHDGKLICLGRKQ
jgi:outer membrane protein assembly factor BamB